MDYKELVEHLKEWNKNLISKMCADDVLTCDDLCGCTGDCIVVQATTAITGLLARAEAAEAHVEQLSERLKHEAENYHAGIELAESMRRSAEARAEKAERELEAVITSVNNGYRIGAITIRSPKFILPGINTGPGITINGWYRTVKEE